MYIPTSIIPAVQSLIQQRVDLQEVRLCKNFLWGNYGKSEELPLFDPKSLKALCSKAGATKLFNAIVNAMSSEDQSSSRLLQNEKKAVAIIYMLVFGQSQKASWFQKLISTMAVSKGISETGLSILNKSGIALSKST